MLRKLKREDIDFEKRIEEIATLEKNIFEENAYTLESIKNFYINPDDRYRIYIKELDTGNPVSFRLPTSHMQEHPIVFTSGEAGELKIVAYLIVLDNIDNYDILKIVIDKNYRNMGVGEELLKNILDKKIFLEVRESNLRAIKFYEKNSFTKISLRKNYYKDNNENAIIMMREASSNYE